MKDVSDWTITGYGENSTLEKLELLSPQNEPYIIKFPRDFPGKRTNWEDVNEVIAAKIAELLHFKTVDAEVAYRKGRRGCLMKHFRYQLEADHGETSASLFSSEFGDKYEELQNGPWKNIELMKRFFSLFESFSLFPQLKDDFVFMNFFDILIGNQDRHAYNWQVLYIKGVPTFGPLYDNGASLGWQLPEKVLEEMLESESKMNKFYKNTKVKIGLDNKESPRIYAKQVLNYLNNNYYYESKSFISALKNFDTDQFELFITNFPLISNTRKEFLKRLVTYRKNKILNAFKEGG